MSADMMVAGSSGEDTQKVFDVPQDIRLNLLLRQRFHGESSMFDYPHVVTVGITSGECGDIDDIVTVVWKYCLQNEEVP